MEPAIKCAVVVHTLAKIIGVHALLLFRSGRLSYGESIHRMCSGPYSDSSSFPSSATAASVDQAVESNGIAIRPLGYRSASHTSPVPSDFGITLAKALGGRGT